MTEEAMMKLAEEEVAAGVKMWLQEQLNNKK